MMSSHEMSPAVGETVTPSAFELGLERGRRKAARKDRAMAIVIPLLLLVFVASAWELAVRALEMPAYLLPAPSGIAGEILGTPAIFLRHAWQTLTEILIGYGLAIVVALPLGVAVSEWKIVERLVYPLLVSSHAVPKSALAPLFIVWFGFGVTPKIAITFLISFFPIVIAAVVGLRSIEQEKLYLARALGMSKLNTFRKFQIPHALPSIFGGLRVGITLAVIGAVVAEFVGADAGLGYLLIIANSTLNTTRLFASLIILMVMSTALFLLVGLVERIAIPWHVSQRKDLQATP